MASFCLRLSSVELEELLEGLGEPAPLGQESFDQFFEGFWKKAKRLAGKALSAVGKIVPVGIVLKKLGALVRPWIKQILGTAIGKLPESVRPLAKPWPPSSGLVKQSSRPTASPRWRMTSTSRSPRCSSPPRPSNSPARPPGRQRKSRF
jgi:hypothetical protein